MSVGPLGSVIFTNQMSANASSVQNAHNNRVDIQNVVSATQLQEKDEKVLEVRPTEENQEVDPDNEQEHSNDSNSSKRNKKNKDESVEENIEQTHHLDILV